MIDADLTGIWIFVADGNGHTVNGVAVSYATDDDYGEPPYRFRAFKQNGSKLHLRLLTPDGKDARYPADDPSLPGQRIERRAYTSDVRRGVYWKREEE